MTTKLATYYFLGLSIVALVCWLGEVFVESWLP